MKIFSTGSKRLDELIGGYEPKKVYHFYGKATTGKTHLTCYQPIKSILSLYTADLMKTNKQMFIVIACDGSFSFNRLSEVAIKSTENTRIWTGILDVIQPKDFDQQHNFIMKLPAYFETMGIKPLLIACDPMTSLYRIEFMNTERSRRLSVALQRTGQLEAQLNVLRSLAEKYECPVTVSNWYKPPIEGEINESEWWREFGGGRGFEYYPSISVRLEEIMKSPKVIKATVVKHRFKTEGLYTYFTITPFGIADLDDKLFEEVMEYDEKRLKEKEKE